MNTTPQEPNEPQAVVAPDDVNTKRFLRLGADYDVRTHGVYWYRHNLPPKIDYVALFSYLAAHLKDHEARLRPQILELLRFQLSFQETYDRMKIEALQEDGSLRISSEALEQFISLCRDLDVHKRKFSASSSIGKIAAGRILQEIERAAKNLEIKQNAQQ